MSDLYDRPSISAGLEALQRRWPHVVSSSDEQPVFILSAGWRSGSTLLQRMLMPSCFVWGEPYGHAWMIDSMADCLRCFTDGWPEPGFVYQGDPAAELQSRFIANLYPNPKHLLAAHLSFFETLFIEPARKAGAERWGVKEVRLGADHAVYLKWLFPRARFLFLFRNPYDAYRSWAARREAGWIWHNRWPDHRLTTRSFGRHWRELMVSFIHGAGDVDGLLVRYEDLAQGEIAGIEEHLGFSLSRSALETRPADGPKALNSIAAPELIDLEQEVGEVAETVGYLRPRAEEPQSLIVSAAGGPGDPSKCVVLVPVGGHIEPRCESALQELERRGYAVRRVRGYAAIDQGRNQMATDALADGFEETMWIDADIEFDPNAVEQLRAHQLPVCSAIYPQKGKRALASHVLPGTESIQFGRHGGLLELLYAATGFLHVRRGVYETMQRQLDLPLCNERFGGRPMVGYFQPLVREDGDGHWYLAEDFAFCERARRCGFKIFADTTIRLHHIGSYRYSWEDAGNNVKRYGAFKFHLSGNARRTAPPAAPREEEPTVEASNDPQEVARRLQELVRSYPWPSDKPDLEPKPNEGWLFAGTRDMLKRVVSRKHRLIVELGSFLGLSTRYIADLAPQATVIAVDHWQGSKEHHKNPEVAGLLSTLYESFLVNCWEYRGRIIPLRMSTSEGLQEVARLHLAPEVIFIDADHDYDAVKADFQTALSLFPSATIVGDDWDWDSVRRAVTETAQAIGRRVDARGSAWRLE